MNIPLLAFVIFSSAGVTAMAGDPNGRAADNRIYAQTLVNQTARNHPELLIIGLHGIPPRGKAEVMIAGNIDHIGNLDSEDDLAAANDHKTMLEPKSPEKFEIVMPLRDAADNYIGAVVMIFKRSPGDTEPLLYLNAISIRDELAKMIPNYGALFKSAP